MNSSPIARHGYINLIRRQEENTYITTQLLELSPQIGTLLARLNHATIHGMLLPAIFEISYEFFQRHLDFQS